MRALVVSGICHAVIMNPTQHGLVVLERQNSHQLETSWQKTSRQLRVSAGSKSFVSILMATKGSQGDSICSCCITQNDFHGLHSWQSIMGRKFHNNQSSSHICRKQGHRNHSIWLLWSVKGGCIRMQQTKVDRYICSVHTLQNAGTNRP